MAGYLKAGGGAGHFPTHPGLSAGLGTGLGAVPMPGLGPFSLGPHSLDPVGFPQGKKSSLYYYHYYLKNFLTL